MVSAGMASASAFLVGLALHVRHLSHASPRAVCTVSALAALAYVTEGGEVSRAIKPWLYPVTLSLVLHNAVTMATAGPMVPVNATLGGGGSPVT